METNLAAKSKELVWEYRKRKWLALGLLLVSALFTLYLILGVLDDRAERILGTLPVLLLDITIYVTFLVLVLAAFLIRQSGGNRINRVYTEDCDPFLYEACLWELQKNIRRNPMLCNLAAAQYQEGNYDHAWETIQKINPYKLRDGFLVSYYSVLSALYFKRGMGRQVEGLERAYQSAVGKRKRNRRQFAAVCARNNLFRAMENRDYPAAFSFLRESEDLDTPGMSQKITRVINQMWEARICLALGDRKSAQMHLHFVASQGGRLAAADEARQILLNMQHQPGTSE